MSKCEKLKDLPGHGSEPGTFLVFPFIFSHFAAEPHLLLISLIFSFQPTLIFAGKARSLPKSGAPERPYHKHERRPKIFYKNDTLL